MIALVGAVITVAAGTNLVLMLALGATIDEDGPVARDEDPARYERGFFASAFGIALGAILLLIAYV